MPAARTLRRALAALAAASLLAACSNSEAPLAKGPHTGTGAATEVGGIQQITITTGPDLRFHPSTVIVHQGKVEILLVNKTGSSGGPPHNLEVHGFPGAFVPLTAAGDTGTTTFTAPSPGRYHFVCTIHVQQGQTGTLIVESGAAGS